MCKKNCCTESWYYPADQYPFVHTSPISNCTLFAIRLFFALYFTGSQIYRFHVASNTLVDIAIYMTNFGYFLNNLYFILVTQDRIFGSKYKVSMRNYIITLYEICFSFEVVITIVYWGFLFRGGSDPLTLYIDANAHAIPLAALLIQFIFNPYSFSIQRSIITIIFALVYSIINIAWSLSVEPVYGILTWVDWFSYALVIGIIALIYVAFGFAILVYHRCCKKKLLKRKVEQNQDQIFQRQLQALKLMEKNPASIQIEPVQDGTRQEL